MHAYCICRVPLRPPRRHLSVAMPKGRCPTPNNRFKSAFMLLGYKPLLPILARRSRSVSLPKSAGLTPEARHDCTTASVDFCESRAVTCTFWGDMCPQAHCITNQVANSQVSSLDGCELPMCLRFCPTPPLLGESHEFAAHEEGFRHMRTITFPH
jgi:hypothetical protein